MKIKLTAPRVGGQPIPPAVWIRIVSTVLPGEEDPNEAKRGTGKSALLKRLCKNDPATKRQVVALARDLMTAEDKATAARIGLAFPEASGAGTLPNLTAEETAIWQEVERIEVERDGKSTLTGWLTQNGVELLREAKNAL
jgi:ABC-type uncharacterized transport system ATPase component